MPGTSPVLSVVVVVLVVVLVLIAAESVIVPPAETPAEAPAETFASVVGAGAGAGSTAGVVVLPWSFATGMLLLDSLRTRMPLDVPVEPLDEPTLESARGVVVCCAAALVTLPSVSAMAAPTAREVENRRVIIPILLNAP
jgi:hypothetical protein